MNIAQWAAATQVVYPMSTCETLKVMCAWDTPTTYRPSTFISRPALLCNP